MSEFRSLQEAFDYVRVLQKPALMPEPKSHKIWKPKPRERIDGGNPTRTPIDRVAARVAAPAPWWAKPPEIKQQKLSEIPKQQHKRTTKKKHKKMNTININGSGAPIVPNQEYISSSGVKVIMVNGQPMMNMDDLKIAICNEIAKLPKETRPNVLAAQDARRIIDELAGGIGGDMERFRADTKRHLEDIRATRFAMVTETSQMTGPLKEIRQFFLGGDYKEEIARLKEFVDLCERLNALKESGFLDNIADTMLRIAK